MMDIDYSEEFYDTPDKLEQLVWIFRPGKIVSGSAFLAVINPHRLNRDGTVEYDGELCQWREFKP